jgi:hypothetical protein
MAILPIVFPPRFREYRSIVESWPNRQASLDQPGYRSSLLQPAVAYNPRQKWDECAKAMGPCDGSAEIDLKKPAPRFPNVQFIQLDKNIRIELAPDWRLSLAQTYSQPPHLLDASAATRPLKRTWRNTPSHSPVRNPAAYLSRQGRHLTKS